MGFERRTSLPVGTKQVCTLAFSLAVLVAALVPVVTADRGGFSPIASVLSESGQRAIIAWNGTHEILVLSTDMKSSRDSDVVEIMPLPSNPTVSRADDAWFLTAARIFNVYFSIYFTRYPGSTLRGFQGYGKGAAERVTITFQKTIGAHYLTVVRAEDSTALTEWVKTFLEGMGYSSGPPPKLGELVENYTRQGIYFFAIDMVRASNSTASVESLMYEFETSKLYYPLRISNLFSGTTQISLFTITSDTLDDHLILSSKFAKKAQFQVKKETISQITPGMTKLFSTNPYMCFYSFTGPIDSLHEDMQADLRPNTSPPTMSTATLAFTAAIIMICVSFSANAGALQGAYMRLVRWPRLTARYAGLIGMSLAALGLVVPWGMADFGYGVLLPLDWRTMISNYSLTLGVVVFCLVALATVLCFAYLQVVEGNSMRAAVAVTAIGGFMTVVALVACTYRLYTAGFGAVATVAGWLLIALSGGLLVRRCRLQTGAAIHPRPKTGEFLKSRIAAYSIVSVVAGALALLLL